MSAPPRPMLRYFGGKWRLAPWIISCFPAHKLYVEPFGGGASVLLRKPRSYSEVYNDLDGDVLNLFRVLQSEASAARLRELLYLTPYARAEFDLAWKPTRNRIERARRLVIRSFMGFGPNACNQKASTGFRNNSNRSGTTPAHDWANYPENLTSVIERLRGVTIESRDALEVIAGKKGYRAQHDGPETLFYVDPPYLSDLRGSSMERNGKRHQYSVEFATEDEHRALATALHNVRGMVVLSGYPSPLYRILYESRGWRRLDRTAFADGARERTECLWLNPAVASSIAQTSLFDSTTTTTKDNDNG